MKPVGTAAKAALRAATPPPPPFTLDNVIVALGSGDGIGTQIRTAGYFAVLISAILLIAAAWPKAAAYKHLPTVFLTLCFSAGALVLTWRLILLFVIDHANLHRVNPDPPNLFVEAYMVVCDDAAGWWWSSLLLMWVVIACPLAVRESEMRGIGPWVQLAYLCAAFLGAVSFSFPLWLLHIIVTPQAPAFQAAVKKDKKEKKRKGAPADDEAPPSNEPALRSFWSTCVGGGLCSVLVLPLVVAHSRNSFIVALIVLHTVLLVPSAYRAIFPSPNPNGTGLIIQDYLAVAASSFMIHLANTARGVAGALESDTPLSTFFAATARNYCQASISIDAVLALFAGGAFVFAQRGRYVFLAYAFLWPLLSPAALFALHGASLEMERMAKKDAEAKKAAEAEEKKK